MARFVRQLSDIYGDLCGYGRSRIRQEVRRHMDDSPAVLHALSLALFQRRVAAALASFPSYAEKVRQHCGLTAQTAALTPIMPDTLPIWIRKDQREMFATLQCPPAQRAFVHSTGGSTGEPTRFYVTRESYEWRMAIADRGYAWAGAEEGRRSYYVWGSPIKPLSPLKKLRVGFQHWLQNRRYFDSFVFDGEHKEACCLGINRFNPLVLVGYAGNLVELALYVRAHPGVLQWKAKTAVTAAEGLQPGQRELLQETLAEEVFLSYGSREFMLIGMECREHRGYHISADNLFVEVVDKVGRTCAPGQTGRILVTDLRNSANPFIRYEIGDLGAMAADPCSCGLPFPLLTRVDGRIQEFLYTSSGEKMTALFMPHLMKDFAWVKGYQLVQSDQHHVQVNVITDVDMMPAMMEPIVYALKCKLGSVMSVTIEKVTSLEKGPSGKIPIVVQPTADNSVFGIGGR